METRPLVSLVVGMADSSLLACKVTDPASGNKLQLGYDFVSRLYRMDVNCGHALIRRNVGGTRRYIRHQYSLPNHEQSAESQWH
jgi:hypothetical protein